MECYYPGSRGIRPPGKDSRIRRTVRSMKRNPRRTCPSCGNHFSGVMEFCPVCMVRKAIDWGAESGESSSEKTTEPAPEGTAQQFGHYELVRGEDGTPV